MPELTNQTNPTRKLGSIQRKALNFASQTELIQTDFLPENGEFPLVIKPKVKGIELKAWAKSNRDFIQAELLKYGAILFRNFQIQTVEEFEELIAAICGEALEYRYRASPRTQVAGRIYTSTDYPPEHSIFPHNEHAYSPRFPLKIFFFCVIPAAVGGATPIGRCRNILQRIDPKIRDRFIEKKVMYVRNFGDGFGLSWQTVFQTTEKSGVEEYCRQNHLEFEWKEGDRLRTRQVGPAICKHPQTGEVVWFNHATFFHISTLETTVRNALLSNFAPEDLPTNTFYGDGSAIEPEVLEHLRECYQQEMLAFPWQKGDILVLDNMLAVHGRQPFEGDRKVLVGMAEPLNSKDVEFTETEV